jgi:hypothetical protein
MTLSLAVARSNHMLYEEMYKEIINGTIKIKHELFVNIMFCIVTDSYKT